MKTMSIFTVGIGISKLVKNIENYINYSCSKQWIMSKTIYTLRAGVGGCSWTMWVNVKYMYTNKNMHKTLHSLRHSNYALHKFNVMQINYHASFIRNSLVPGAMLVDKRCSYCCHVEVSYTYSVFDGRVCMVYHAWCTM